MSWTLGRLPSVAMEFKLQTLLSVAGHGAMLTGRHIRKWAIRRQGALGSHLKGLWDPFGPNPEGPKNLGKGEGWGQGVEAQNVGVKCAQLPVGWGGMRSSGGQAASYLWGSPLLAAPRGGELCQREASAVVQGRGWLCGSAGSGTKSQGGSGGPATNQEAFAQSLGAGPTTGNCPGCFYRPLGLRKHSPQAPLSQPTLVTVPEAGEAQVAFEF